MGDTGLISYTRFSNEALRPNGMLLRLSTACIMRSRWCLARAEPVTVKSVTRARLTILTEEAAFGRQAEEISAERVFVGAQS